MHKRFVSKYIKRSSLYTYMSIVRSICDVKCEEDSFRRPRPSIYNAQNAFTNTHRTCLEAFCRFFFSSLFCWFWRSITQFIIYTDILFHTLLPRRTRIRERAAHNEHETKKKKKFDFFLSSLSCINKEKKTGKCNASEAIEG